MYRGQEGPTPEQLQRIQRVRMAGIHERATGGGDAGRWDRPACEQPRAEAAGRGAGRRNCPAGELLDRIDRRPPSPPGDPPGAAVGGAGHRDRSARPLARVSAGS